MKEAIFYHAGCSVCISAEQQLAANLDKQLCEVEFVHLGDEPQRIAEAESYGIKSVPALVVDKVPFHINFGASINDLKGVE
ncbi:MAG: thioredoxin family protein [Cellvibrionaceae bacterium]